MNRRPITSVNMHINFEVLFTTLEHLTPWKGQCPAWAICAQDTDTGVIPLLRHVWFCLGLGLRKLVLNFEYLSLGLGLELLSLESKPDRQTHKSENIIPASVYSVHLIDILVAFRCNVSYSLIDVISWSDFTEYRVVAIFKRTIGGNAWTINHFQFNRQMAWCHIHWRRCYVHRVFNDTVDITNMI